MVGTALTTRAAMYGIPDFENEIKRMVEGHMAENAALYPMPFEDLISTIFPDRDFNETKAVKSVLYAAVKVKPQIVGSWFQPSYRGSQPPRHKDGSPRFPKWAEIAIGAGVHVEFLKEQDKRRKFGPPKALSVDSDLNRKLGDVKLRPETALEVHESNTMLARASVNTLEAVCLAQAAFGGEIRDLSITQDDLKSNLDKLQRERDLLFNNNMDLQQRMTEKDDTIRAREQLIAELQEQVINLGGTPILQASGSFTTRTSLRPQ